MNILRPTVPVSVIIPVRNRPELLREALESVIQGTVLPAEIIVVSNGKPEERSRDREGFESWKTQMDSPLLRHSAPIFLELRHKVGPAAARNLGAQKANQSYLAFLDSDDLWHADKLDRQLRFLQKRPHLKACHSQERWLKDQKELSVPRRLLPVTGRPLKESLDVCLISASSLLIERSGFLQMQGFDERFPSCEDYEFWIRYFLAGSMGCLEEPLITKRSGSWNQVSSSGLLDLQRLRALVKNARSLRDQGLPESLLTTARKKAGILMQKEDAPARQAKRLLRKLARTLDASTQKQSH
ncbi:MAG: hypothetical protein CMN76_01995 [Spirochaetaceae bacterium]|mgnify:CR=1 FL=1|nr:hypothetical protein [Spirochaetaceae bacterium]|tara:strand:+ start:54367 stop:55263 length:897 start_codon:yes stop_codon:yes gene_type:complete